MSQTTMINWAISALALVGIVLLLRHFFGEKISRRMRYGLWLVVLLRLLVPVSWGSTPISVQNVFPIFSLMENNSTQNGTIDGDNIQKDTIQKDDVQEPAVSGDGTGDVLISNGQSQNTTNQNTDMQSDLSQSSGTQNTGAQNSGAQNNMPQSDSTQNNVAQNPSTQNSSSQNSPSQENISQYSEQTGGEANGLATLETMLSIAIRIWKLGAVLALLWVAIINIRFYRQLKNSRQYIATYQGTDVYVTSDITSPCLFGVWHPAIYLTPQVTEDEETMGYALLHERCHKSHGDHVWALLRGVCLAIWWWNPLVWMAAGCCRQDCELACDEACVQQLGEEHRQEYGMALIHSLQDAAKNGERRYSGAAATLFSGKQELKERLRALGYRPQVRYSAIAAVAVTVLVGVLITFTGRDQDASGEESTQQEETQIDTTREDDIFAEETSEAAPDETVPQTNPSGLTDTVRIYTYVFPWESTGVRETPEQGVAMRELAVPVFASDCKYYINKIHYNNHGIDYQETDEETFLDTVEGMEEKGFSIRMQAVYEKGEIVEAYLESDQQVASNMTSRDIWDPLAWDPERPPYEYIGLDAYTLGKECQADISAAEGVETIGIYTITMNDGYDAVVVVHDANGGVHYAKSISTHHSAVEEIFLVEEDGADALMIRETSQQQGSMSYNYWIFRLDAEGNPVQSAGAGYGFEFALYRGYHTYDPSQLQLWAQPIYYKYMEEAVLLAGINNWVSSDVYYESRGSEAYHHTTLQAEAEAARDAYWHDVPAAMYEDPDFEEYATIKTAYEGDDRLWLQLGWKSVDASVSPKCRFYVRKEIDQYPYEEIDRDEFLQLLEDKEETYAHLQYENGWIINVFVEGLHNGVKFTNPFHEDLDGCRYVENIILSPQYAHAQYDWTQYQLEVQYEADLSDYEGMETISIYSGSMLQMPTEEAVLLKVENAEGKMLFLDELGHFGHAKTAYYLGERDGQQYLVLLYLEDRYHHGEFRYNAFRLDVGNTQLSGCLFDWSVDRLDEASVFPKEEFLLWASKAHYYLEDAECILYIDTSGVGEGEFQYDWDSVIDWQEYGEEIATRE